MLPRALKDSPEVIPARSSSAVEGPRAAGLYAKGHLRVALERMAKGHILGM